MQILHRSTFSRLYKGSMTSSPRALSHMSPIAGFLMLVTISPSIFQFPAFIVRVSKSSLVAVSPAFMGVIKVGKDDHIVSFRMIIRDNHVQ